MRYSSILIISIVIFVSCSTKSKPVYQLTTTVEPIEAGSVSPAEANVNEGDSIQITASSNEHWVFDQWIGDHTGTNNPTSVVMGSDKSLTAIFIKTEYPLTVNVTGLGTVDERIVQAKSTDYPYGALVELTASTEDGWELNSWSGDLSENGNTRLISVDGAKSVTAIFEPSGRLDFRSTNKYDSRDNIIERVYYNPDGSIDRRYTYRYDSRDNRTETISYNADGNINYRETISYDSNNNFIEVIIYNSDGSIDFRATGSYDSRENLTEVIEYNPDGSIDRRYTYQYDSNDNRTEVIEYNSDGSIDYRYTYQYDSNDNRTEYILYNSDGRKLTWLTYRYDSRNNRTERIRYNSDGSISSSITYSYDSNQNLTEQISYDSEGSINSRTTYSYDTNENLMERTSYNSDGSVYREWTRYPEPGNNFSAQVWYDRNGLIQFIYYDKYNSDDQVIEWSSYTYDTASGNFVAEKMPDTFDQYEWIPGEIKTDVHIIIRRDQLIMQPVDVEWMLNIKNRNFRK